VDGSRLLVVDDDAEVGNLLTEALAQWGYQPTLAASGSQALGLLKRQAFDAAILDIGMPDMDGLTLLEAMKDHDATIDVIMITGDPMVSTAIRALKSGAYDYLIKPPKLDELRHLMGQLMERRRLQHEVRTLRSQLGRTLAERELVGTSPAIREMKQTITTVAASDASVMIEGESGTGKELVAAAIHRESPRSSGPFVPVNCGAIPAELMESEFFGHVRGAFTGAVADALGLIRSAQGGTLLLDEVGELPLALQSKLLRVLQEKEVRPVGSAKTHAIDVRVITATNRDLEAAVKSGGFRQDLYYRINVVRIVVPPLRARREDISALALALLRRFNERFRREVRGLAPDALAALMAYDFPGNVRELENILERAYAFGAHGEITLANLPPLGAVLAPAAGAPAGTIPTVEEAERQLIARALQHYDGDKEQAARALGLTVRTFYRRLRKFGLK
jgi:DNA-binding NtrC family response regulator